MTVYDLDYKEEGVTLRDPKNNDLMHYVLREFDGKVRDKYLNAVGKVTKTMPDGTSKVLNFEGLQGKLISACMFPATRKGEGTDEAPFVYTVKEGSKPVDLAFAQALPSTIATAIFETCQNICGLDADAEDKAKEE